MTNPYDNRYGGEAYYWGKKPSAFCRKVIELLPPRRALKLIDIGCGEGRNAVFFAGSGYDVTALDLSPQGVSKTRQLAEAAGVSVRAFEADVIRYRLQEEYDIVFCHGCLQYIRPELRAEVLGNYRACTSAGGLNALSAFVSKPFIAEAPDAEATAHKWISGELFTHYHNWRLDYCAELIFDCTSSGIPHKHAMDLLIARRV